MATQFKLRRDAAATWTSVNPTLAQGEPGYETDTGKGKIGNGSTPWNSLPYTWFPAAQLVLATLMDAKGDLIVATAADTAARLPVGANGLTLVADSAEATGLAWKRRGWEHVLDATASGSASFIDLDAILFDGYLTVIEWEGAIAASSTSLALRMLSSGTPVTGANYNYGGYLANTGQTSAVVGFISAEGGFGEIRVAKGANAAATRIDGDCVNGTSAPVVGDQAAAHTLATAYTGVRLISASGSNLAAGSRFAVYRVKV